MTDRKSTYRKRRISTATGLPADLIAWFSGETDAPPWSALLHPDADLLPERWAQYLAEHPNAPLPAGCCPEWLG